MLCGKQMPPAADDSGTAQMLPVEADRNEDRATVAAEASHPIAASHEVFLHAALTLS